ncbi:hypothetical protein MGN01_23100 [Methylobacterium gnaphalii]|uniref:Uncharacterized protein n=1 Tax=Methylobacterium gnaphalii TaxID=1010610 RepID=A0A512JKH5_9HYPH|nr:hypothetical protein MGN01_23100 [Methylobacterium gnaphalii]GLS47802.1 hypothetical protein GCM10007885_06460 [Methylobacterium gnaphalii]
MILTLLVLPSVRASADRLVVPQAAAAAARLATSLPGTRPASLSISPIHRDTASEVSQARPATRTNPAIVGPSASEREMLPKPRRMMREGCEAPLSSLVGPEARRMVPGRCMV